MIVKVVAVVLELSEVAEVVVVVTVAGAAAGGGAVAVAVADAGGRLGHVKEMWLSGVPDVSGRGACGWWSKPPLRTQRIILAATSQT